MNIKYLETALDDIKIFCPSSKAIFISGDSTDGFEEDYNILDNIFKKKGLLDSSYFAMGNHEFYKAFYKNKVWSSASFPNGETEQMSIEKFKKAHNLKSVYYDLWIENAHFIILGPEKYRQSLGNNIGDSCYMSDEQINWLDQKLKENKEENQVNFIISHIPLPKEEAKIDMKEEAIVIQYEKVKNVLKNYKNIVLFSGHTHYKLDPKESIYEEDGVTYINNSTISKPINSKTGELTDGSEGLYIEVYDDNISVKGLDFKNKIWIKDINYKINVSE
jgi:hypothetical protein